MDDFWAIPQGRKCGFLCWKVTVIERMTLSLKMGLCILNQASLVVQIMKESTCNIGDPGSIPGSGRSPGGRNGYPLQYSCLENPMDRGALWATVHGVAKSQAWLTEWISLSFHSELQVRFFLKELKKWIQAFRWEAWLNPRKRWRHFRVEELAHWNRTPGPFYCLNC